MDEMENRLARLPGALLPWYRENRRVLPWREEVSAYRTWVSEIMLQQTRVAAVIPYFQRFMAAYPTVEDLAACDEGELMRLWAGLGYYSRARNLRRAARVIAEEYGGAFPRTYQQLMALPGVGDYTAGAILSIAFGEPVPAVDGNVLRVAARVSMGNVFLVPWTYLPEGERWPELLHELGFKTVALALRDDSLTLNDPRLLAEPKLAMVLGTEGDGLASSTIAACDYTVKIPMSHGVDSLNVAAASAVAFYQLALLNG